MVWNVKFYPDFAEEFTTLNIAVQETLNRRIDNLRIERPHLGRPYADTLQGSRHANMKELRLKADGGVWRFAFAFDPEQKAIILCGGDKSGLKNQSKFYRALIEKADGRFEEHLEKMQSAKDASKQFSRKKGRGRKK